MDDWHALSQDDLIEDVDDMHCFHKRSRKMISNYDSSRFGSVARHNLSEKSYLVTSVLIYVSLNSSVI